MSIPKFLSLSFIATDLVELDKTDFDVILRINWLHSFYDSLDYRNRAFQFKFLNEPVK